MRRLPWRLASDELRVTGVEMERASPRGMTGKKASAPLPSAAPPPSPAGEGKNLWAHMLLACHPERAQRAEGSLKTICEKAKTALFAFSPYSGELHAERVKAARVYKPRAPKGAQREKTGRRVLRSISERRVVSPITAFRRQQPAEERVNIKQFLRVRKPRLSVSAPHLPHTCGSCRKGEGAAF